MPAETLLQNPHNLQTSGYHKALYTSLADVKDRPSTQVHIVEPAGKVLDRVGAAARQRFEHRVIDKIGDAGEVEHTQGSGPGCRDERHQVKLQLGTCLSPSTNGRLTVSSLRHKAATQGDLGSKLVKLFV